jgi:hypothetical protein
MGCLKVDIKPISGNISVECEKVEGITGSVQKIGRKCCGLMKALVTIVSGIFISTRVIDSGFGVDVNSVSSIPTISLELVCGSNYGTEQFLKVAEGCLLTIDGCFLKVMR